MRKTRTRQHFIEDLSYNYVEKQTLLARCTLQKYLPDYSYDASIHTYNDLGEIENGEVYVQLKSTDKINFSKKRNAFTFDLSKRDLELWLYNILPVILVLYDAKNDIGYYIELKEYFQENKLVLGKINKFIRVFLPEENVFTIDGVKKLRNLKNRKYGIYEGL